jgi:signal transduction histidine kinase/HPt (histidine-containing phosphotransfer) domain-containing protein/FixJ family two-component response regulator
MFENDAVVADGYQATLIAELQKENLRLVRQLARLSARMERDRMVALGAATLSAMRTKEQQKREKYMSMLATSSPDSFLLLDGDGNVDICTDAFLRMAGIADFSEINGMPLGRVLKLFADVDWVDALMEQFAMASAADDFFFFKRYLRLNTHAGSRIYRLHCSFMRGVDGATDGALVLLVDITEIEKARKAEQLHAAAEQVSAAKSEFLARMSHEIRTPLNSILGIAEIVSQMDIPDKAREYLSILAMSGNSLLAIINDILDFSKIESGSMKIESSEYSFTSLLNDSINIIQILFMGKPQLDFVVRVDPTIPDRLIGDEVRIRQILFNLLSNAIKYTNNGYIALTIQHEKSVNSTSLIISVEDTGIGIDEENFANIFDAFTRVNAKQYANVEGTGLGLAITKTLCAMMGGELSVKSARQSGSCFTAVIPQEYVGEEIAAKVVNPSSTRSLLYIENPMQLESLLWAFEDLGLPEPRVVKDCKDLSGALLRGNYEYAIVFPKVVSACLPVLEGTPTKLIVLTRFNESTGLDHVENLVCPAHSVTLAGMLNGERPESGASRFRRRYAFPEARILVVDDIPANLLVAKELLAKYGARIDTSTNGADAVEIVKKYPYDIVFMDHMMPGMDGVAATIAIRAKGENIARCRDVPVIALTANAMSGHREIFLQCGMNDFLAKPIEVEKLDKILVKYLPVEKRVEIADRREAAAASPAGIEGIEGVDTRTGLRNVGGSADAYRDILREFCRDVQTKIGELEEALNNERLKDYTILAHSIKGMAGIIGAGHVAGLAAALEEAATKENWGFLRVGTGPFLIALRDILSKIRGALHAQVPPSARAENPPADIDSFKLDVMREALGNMDIQTANNLLAEYMAMDINDEQRRKISELDRLITSFEFDDAIEIIDAWKNEASR